MRKEIEGKVFYEDSKGGWIPEEAIKEIDLLRDQTVTKIAERTKQLQEQMIAVKRQCIMDIEEFLKIAFEDHKVHFGGEKGNLTLSSFDGKYRVQLATSDVQEFTEGIHAAKQLIDECLSEWTKDSNANLKAVVTKAFKMNQGRMDVKRILELRSLKVNDYRWDKAMDIINDSLRVISTREYFRMHQRDDSGRYAQMDLDLSVV